MKSRSKMVVMSLMATFMFTVAAKASEVTLVNGANFGCAGSVGCTITMNDGSTMYFSAHSLNLSAGLASSVNLWDYSAGAAYFLGNGQFVQTAGTRLASASNQYSLTIIHAPVTDANGNVFYVDMTENFGMYYSNGGGGRGGGGAGWHYKVLNGSITFTK